MKHFYILLFIIPFTFKAQVYHRFPTADVTWFESDGKEYYPLSSPTYTVKTYFKHILRPTNTDTTIGSFVYKKVFFQWFATVGQSYFACYREDTLTNKIYMIEKDSIIPRLIYDFSPHMVGDTIKNIYLPRNNTNPYPIFTANFVVNSIDSVLIASVYHKRYNLYVVSAAPGCTGPYCIAMGRPAGWIEGYGSMAGLFQDVDIVPTLSMFSYIFKTECISKAGVSIFPAAANCLTVGVDELYTSSLFNIYPNPVTTKVSIEFKGALLEYELFNSLGEKLSEGLINEKKEIDLSGLNNGIYFLKVSSDNGYRVNKIIKE